MKYCVYLFVLFVYVQETCTIKLPLLCVTLFIVFSFFFVPFTEAVGDTEGMHRGYLAPSGQCTASIRARCKVRAATPDGANEERRR